MASRFSRPIFGPDANPHFRCLENKIHSGNRKYLNSGYLVYSSPDIKRSFSSAVFPANKGTFSDPLPLSSDPSGSAMGPVLYPALAFRFIVEASTKTIA
jgi:hypothetical protein